MSGLCDSVFSQSHRVQTAFFRLLGCPKVSNGKKVCSQTVDSRKCKKRRTKREEFFNYTCDTKMYKMSTFRILLSHKHAYRKSKVGLQTLNVLLFFYFIAKFLTLFYVQYFPQFKCNYNRHNFQNYSSVWFRLFQLRFEMKIGDHWLKLGGNMILNFKNLHQNHYI